MKLHLSAYLFLLCALSASAAPTPLDEARTRWLKGNYEEAEAEYKKLLDDPKHGPAAAIGLSRALASQGEYDKALAAVEKAVKASPKNADLLARQADLLYFRGRWDEALKAADAAIDLHDKNFAARWVRAQVYRDKGDHEKALQAVVWFLRTYDPDSKVPYSAEDLMYIGLGASEYARWKARSDDFETILNEIYKDALKAEPDFWPVEYQAGLLLLEKYNRGEALEALDKALTINPSAAEAEAAKGVAALARFEIKEAERLAERSLKFNANLPEGLRLRADVYLATGDAASALKELDRAKKINPRDSRTLARLAACYHLQKKQTEFDAVVKEVEKYDSKPAPFYFELGERLEERRRYDEAEKYYALAARLRPHLPGPHNGLGMLYMRLGREDAAEPLLEKGFKADKFNVRVSNMRKVLRHLEKYKTIKTAHFHIRYDPAGDSVLANYLASYLEEVYADLAKKFDYTPKGPFLVEVFNNHEMFSGRTVALPDLHTIGACTGRVVTMVTPNEERKGKPVRKPFNWGRVMRHEIVHIFNLDQTKYLVPHWLTEGLAVQNEGFPRPQIWNKLLVERVPEGKVLTLDTIDLGFIRPRDPLEWQQAYCQALLYVEYIQKEYGQEAIGKLLAAFAAGLSVDESLARACKGVDRKTFEKGYRAHLDTVIKPLLGNRKPEKKRTLDELEAEYKKNANDPDVAAELALKLLGTRKAEARKLAEEALKNKKRHPKASYVLARLANNAGNEREERKLLEDGFDKDNPDPLVGKALGKLLYDASEFDKAGEVYEVLRKAEPQERDWLVELVRIYTQVGNKSRQISVLMDLVPLDADDLDRRLRLTKLLNEAGKPAEAEKFARQAIEIDIKNAEAREQLFKALEGQKKKDELNRLKGILEPK